MLKRVHDIGKQPRLVEELSGLQMGEAQAEWCLGHLGDGLQEDQGHLRADDGSRLQEVFLLRRQPVNARRQHDHSRGHVQGGEWLRQTIRPRFSAQVARLHQGPHALFQKEGIACRAGHQQRCEWCEAGVVPQQRLHEFVRAGGWQQVEPQVDVRARLPHGG